MIRRFRGAFTEELPDGGLKDCELVILLDHHGMLIEPVQVAQESSEYGRPNPSGASE